MLSTTSSKFTAIFKTKLDFLKFSHRNPTLKIVWFKSLETNKYYCKY